MVCSVIKLLNKRLLPRDNIYYNAFEIYHIHQRSPSVKASSLVNQPEDALAEAVSCFFLSYKINSAFYDRLSLNRLMAEYWVGVSDKSWLKSQHHLRSERHLFEERVVAFEAKLLVSLGYNFQLAPIFLSNSIEGSINHTCTALRTSEKTFNAAKAILKEDYFVYSDFCLLYEDMYLVCAAIVIASSQTHKKEEGSKRVTDATCSAKFGLETDILEKLIYRIKNRGSFWFACE